MKGGAASPDNAADGLAEEEKMAVATSSSMVNKDLTKHGNGKPQNVKNVTWGANTVQEFHTEYNGSPLQGDVEMRVEDAGDGKDEQKNMSSSTPKQPVPKHEVKAKPCESNKKQNVQYILKVKAAET